MKAFLARNKVFIGGLGGVCGVIAVGLFAMHARSAVYEAVERGVESDAAGSLRAIEERQKLLARSQACMLRAQSVKQLSDCVRTGRLEKTTVEGSPLPLNRRRE